MPLPRRRPAPRALAPRAALAALALLGGACHAPLEAQSRERDDFTWSGTVPAGRTTYIKNVNGLVRVERSPSGKVEVTGTKRWRRGDPADVRIELRRIGEGEQDVLLCALWGERTSCDARGMRSESRGPWRRDNDVSVEFVVRLPDGVRVDATTVNGNVEVRGVTGEVVAHSVNGNVDAASTGGPVRARTVNGDVYVRMTSTAGATDLDYATTNGSVVVELPPTIGADVELATVNGRVQSDFAMLVSGTVNPRRLRATIGDGQIRLRARTVNGSVALRKATP
jgi:hypothetical protein